ncbi:phage baseplate assembly protein V [Paenibacillus septentrionalis]|uniref:Phage baseplate assembly protein V n=1 Tax=Paenibacillus septentrionalis TaxID=429342 RepID=A0ABW1V9I1_9BACL
MMLYDYFTTGSRQDEHFTMNGVYSGIVTDNKDPDSNGRVKVKIPVIDDQKEFDWMRIVAFMGGKDRGALFIPEVGDEVLIAFMMGDITAPIVIGSLWNKEEPPPAGNNDKNDIRKIKTRSGHEITFDDNDQAGKITVKTKKGHQLEFADKEQRIELRTANSNHKVMLDEQKGQVTIQSSQATLTMNQKGEIEIKAPKSIKLSGGQIQIEASSTLEMKANANVNISASGMLQLKGSIIKLN